MDGVEKRRKYVGTFCKLHVFFNEFFSRQCMKSLENFLTQRMLKTLFLLFNINNFYLTQREIVITYCSLKLTVIDTF